MSPERVNGDLDKGTDDIKQKADMWSVGVIMFMLFFGKAPFEGSQNSSLVKSIRAAHLEFKSSGWSEEE